MLSLAKELWQMETNHISFLNPYPNLYPLISYPFFMEGNYNLYHQNTTQMTPTPTTTTTTTTTFSSLDSSGSDQYMEGADFEVSDLFSFEEWAMAEPEILSTGFGQTAQTQTQNLGYQGNAFYDHGGLINNQNEGESSRGSRNSSREKKEVKGRVAFRMKSEIEVIEDGYKWRKYGKKMVKNSPNPRNYYRCSADGCVVKKRVERDREDPRYVITTYDGIHNHEPTK